MCAIAKLRPNVVKLGFNPKTENSPALVKACMDNNLEITKILVDNGFILRLVGKNQSSI